MNKLILKTLDSELMRSEHGPAFPDSVYDLVDSLRENGFTIIFSRYSSTGFGKTYFNFMSPSGGFGYLEFDRYGRFKLSSSYKATREHGTGAEFMSYAGIEDMTPENLEKATKATIRGRGPNYKSLHDFVKSSYAECVVMFPIEVEA